MSRTKLAKPRLLILVLLASGLALLLWKAPGPHRVLWTPAGRSSEKQIRGSQPATLSNSPSARSGSQPGFRLPAAGVEALKRKTNDIDSTRLVVEVVESENGRPIPGVHIALEASEGETTAECETGPGGSCVFESNPEVCRLLASKSGYLPVTKEVQLLSAHGLVHIRMSRSVSVSGTVRDERSMRLAGASVTLAPKREVPHFGVFSATSAANGAFSLNVTPGEYYLLVGLPGYQNERRELEISGEMQDLEVILKLEGDIWFTGQVVSMGSGRPIPGVLVRTPGGMGDTDAAGRFRFRTQSSPEPVTVEITPLHAQGSYESATETLVLNRNTHEVFRLREKRTFRLIVTDGRGESVPVSDLWVSAWSPSGERASVEPANIPGRFSVSKYPAYIRAGAKTIGSVSLPVFLPEYQFQVQLDIPPGGQLQGIVFDEGGAPVQDFVLTLQDDEGHDLFSRKWAEPNGVFRFSQIAAGVYQVRVESAGGHPLARSRGNARVTVREGQTTYTEIQLKKRARQTDLRK
ncbi:MAG TPA: carboxypeptidase-like regulatory domain-containing protein [Acidobacteriota bacterium]|nr:carboxypeptidase-like regulatory domain-containing protein [Acidobacteriota bacterium]